MSLHCLIFIVLFSSSFSSTFSSIKCKEIQKLSDWIRPQFSAVVNIKYLRRNCANTPAIMGGWNYKTFISYQS